MVYRNAEKYASKDAPFRIYIGYDSHEDIAWEVCRHSIMSRSSVPVDIIPLKRAEFQKRKVYYREHDPKQSTEFTYLRFLVPYLNNYRGWAMFVDDDFLFMRDIAELLDLIDDRYALMCVQHDYKPTVTKKLAGKEQEPYPRKNWSSLVLWNCGHPVNQAVTLGLVNSETGRYLHRFSWIEDDSLIGSLPVYWNFLTPWYKKLEDSTLPGAVHYTEGGPWFPDYRQDAETDYKEEWFEELKKYEATLAQPRQLCPYELFSQNGVKPLSGYSNSTCRWDWDAEKMVATA